MLALNTLIDRWFRSRARLVAKPHRCSFPFSSHHSQPASTAVPRPQSPDTSIFVTPYLYARCLLSYFWPLPTLPPSAPPQLRRQRQWHSRYDQLHKKPRSGVRRLNICVLMSSFLLGWLQWIYFEEQRTSEVVYCKNVMSLIHQMLRWAPLAFNYSMFAGPGLRVHVSLAGALPSMAPQRKGNLLCRCRYGVIVKYIWCHCARISLRR